ncbi:ATP-dependent DNA helicase PIF1-like [Senna tora]|uniref:ATP-dependent DNA helicase n=1 Tax=Senna tora TaxID=362788 RepID=A0A835CMI3_9FABA|nr:ATP-dependent DNA helicase PIF1-like [Senna tora]
MFPCGEDSYHQDALFRFADFNSTKKERTFTLKQYFAFILQDRRADFNIFLRCGKLTQQFIVHGYTMIESQRLLYIRLHKKDLRADSYITLTQALPRGEATSSSIGKRIVLPSSFTREYKLTNEALIDSVICAKIPDPDSNPKLFEAVSTFMIYGPCGLDRKSSPCMDIALAEIENLLNINGRSLSDYPPMPMPSVALLRNIENLLISEELNYDRNALKSEHANLLSSLTYEQRFIYDTIISAVKEKKPGMFSIDGFGGSGMTYIWKTLTSAIRSNGDIVLAVASSGIASQLIPGGSDIAKLMVQTKLTIWNEPPMAHWHCFEVLDRTLRDIMHSQNAELTNQPFGGNVVLFGGGSRQILPVIPRATLEDIVLASLNASYLWSSCQVLTLTKNMRLAPDDDVLIHSVDEPVQSIVHNTYPNFLENYHNHAYSRYRTIMSPTLDDVAQVNEYMLGLLPGEEHTYLISDTNCNQDPKSQLAEVYTTEFLNTISSSGLPYHQFKLKVDAPVMLLHNIDHSMGLCNGTRLNN